MNCTSCGKDLKRRSDAFGEIGQPLCWVCYSAMLAEIEETERNERERIEETKRIYSGFCPLCQAKLEVGVAEWSVGRTCPHCGYHDYSLLYGDLMTE